MQPSRFSNARNEQPTRQKGYAGRSERSEQPNRPDRPERSEQPNRPPKINKSFQPNHLQMRILPPANVSTVDSATPEYALEKLMATKTRLNNAKSKLDVYYNLSKTDAIERNNFQQFQNIIDLYKPMRFKIQKEHNAKHVTNAWMKYWELYTQYNVVPVRSQDRMREPKDRTQEPKDRKFLAFFNAELPGAALCAFNHYMHTMRPDVEFDWRASSLAPTAQSTLGEITTQSALGDNYGLFAHNRDKWLMTLPTENGRKNNGDVTNLINIEDFAATIGPESEFGGVDFYSHDAGIDVSDDFNNQELANAKVHLGCALTGFMTLRKGGTFIAKQYTFFETFTWNLLIIYAQLFEEFYICKPLTSRPYNSEIYLVGKGFRGLPANIKDLLSERLTNFNTSPLIPADATRVQLGGVTAEIIRFSHIVFIQQAQFIEENVKLYETYKTRLGLLRKGLDGLKYTLIADWLKKYPVGTIADQDQLPSN